MWSTANMQPVETTILNAPWDEHSSMFFKSVPDLYFIGLCCTWQSQAPLSTTPYQYKNDTLNLTFDLTYQTYYLSCFAVDNKRTLPNVWSPLLHNQ